VGRWEPDEPAPSVHSTAVRPWFGHPAHGGGPRT
jgi:hypothetical protein